MRLFLTNAIPQTVRRRIFNGPVGALATSFIQNRARVPGLDMIGFDGFCENTSGQ